MKKIANTVALALATAGSMEAANELWLPADSMDMMPGVICAANEARFTSSKYSEPLTGYIVGWKDPENLEALLEQIAPAVPVNRRFEFKKAVNAEAFLSETDDNRAIGSAFKRVEYTGTSVNEKTYNKGLTIRLDKDEMMDGDEELNISRLSSRLLRNEVRRALTLIDAASNNIGKVWDATKNPDGDVRAILRSASGKSGIRPNCLLYAEDAWDLRSDAYELQNTPAGGRAASFTPEQLAAKLMVDTVLPVKAKFQNTLTAKAQVQTALTVLLYYRLSGIGKDDPSNVKRFTTPTGSGRFRVYRNEHDKWIDLSVEHYSNTVITSTIGIEKITASAT